MAALMSSAPLAATAPSTIAVATEPSATCRMSDLPVRLPAAMSVDGLEQRHDELPFVLGQLRAPDVEQQYDPRPVASVPGLVLDRIVEGPALAFDPVACFVADAEPALAGHDDGKMADEARVHEAVVGRDVRPGPQQREQDRG